MADDYITISSDDVAQHIARCDRMLTELRCRRLWFGDGPDGRAVDDQIQVIDCDRSEWAKLQQ